jgi:hypothetical protein
MGTKPANSSSLCGNIVMVNFLNNVIAAAAADLNRLVFVRRYTFERRHPFGASKPIFHMLLC